mmetsp:Transcript_132665/g.383576  ORF Transcript_132665/g.383576 Transcript_132665/m.383576 type:complete len:472 (-) Transcript_132665:110-1525(-)
MRSPEMATPLQGLDPVEVALLHLGASDPGLEGNEGTDTDMCPLLDVGRRRRLAPSPRGWALLGTCSAAAAALFVLLHRGSAATSSQDLRRTLVLQATGQGASCARYGCQHGFVAKLYCQCDSNCMRERNDCCPDFDAVCKGTAGAAEQDFQERPTPEAIALAKEVARNIDGSGDTPKAPPELPGETPEDIKDAANVLREIMHDVATRTTEAPHSADEVPTTTSTRWPYPSLFCWLVMRIQGYEVALVRAQHSNRVGIFDCDEYAVYSNGGAMQIGTLSTIQLPAPVVQKGNFNVPGTTTDSWLNTLIFMEAWAMIVEGGTWWRHEWTVKIDPDAVFFPDRLRELLLVATPDPGAKPQYVGNCDRSWHTGRAKLKLFGSLEIYSRDAVGSYKAFGSRCKTTLNWKRWGEDFFMQNCMEMLGATPVNGTSFLADKRCRPAPCSDSTKVAFHDFKDVQSYFDCWGQSRINGGSI